MFNYILLGIIQGVFEWLPISSEGISSLFSHFFIKGFNPVDLALFLHLGTLLAVIIYFRKDWWEIITFKNKKLLRFLFIATVISLLISYPIYKMIKNAVLGGSLLLVVGLGLLITAFFHKKNLKIKIKLDHLALLTGFLQGLAVIPGLSRSGATIFSLSLNEENPEKILKVSYLMSGPIVLASSFYLFLENPNLASQSWPALIASFIFGMISLKILINWSKKINFFKFALFFSLICFLGAILSFIL